MPIVSAGDLTLLRGQGHRSDVYTSFLVPPILWQARIDDASIVQGETSIDFDQGTGSFFSLVEAVQDLWVGNSASKDDVGGPGNGRLRIRSISSGDGGVTGTVTVGGHSLPLTDNLYLTFKHDYPLRPRWSYIDPATEIWYIDDNITYSDQHEEPPPVVIAGPHRAGFLDSGSFAINVDASGSYTIAQGATKSSYALSVASTAGSPTVNFNTGTGLGDITFTAPGYYWAKYSVTDSNGKTQVSYRCYIVHDNDPSLFYPYVDARNITLTGDWSTGGWVCGIESNDSHSFDEIPAHTLAIMWRESWYGTTKKNITFLPDSTSTIFAGYVRGEAEEQDMEDGMGNVDLILSTIDGRLARIYAFSASLVAQQSGVNHWGEIPNWHTVGTIVHALLRWRSTLFELTDVIGLRDNSWRRAGYEPDDNNLYEMVNNFSFNEGIRARLVCDQGGRMHFAHDMQLMIASERAALNTTFALQKDVNAADYGGSLIIPRAPEPEAPFVTSNGIYWDGTDYDSEGRPEPTGDWCVIAPGGKPLHEGPSPKDFPKQTIPSLAYLRELAGRYLGQTNNPMEEIRIDFAGDYLGVLDIAYDDSAYEISLASGDTPRGQVLTNHPIYCRNIAARYRSGDGTWLVEAAFEPFSEGITGVETECPSFPPLGGIIPIIPLPDQVPGALLTGASVNYKSANGAAWTQRVAQQVSDLVEDPYWRTKTSSTDPSNAIVFRCGLGYIKRSTDAFISTDVDVTPSTNPPNGAGDSPAPTNTTVTYIQGEGSYVSQNNFVFLATWQNSGGDWRTWLVHTANNGTSWTWKQLGAAGTDTITSFGTKVDVSPNLQELHSWTSEQGLNSIAVMDPTKVVACWVDAGDTTPPNPVIRATVLNIAGDTITPGTTDYQVNDDDEWNTPRSFEVSQINENKFLVVWTYYDYGPGGWSTKAKIGTVSGNSISFGSEATWTDGSDNSFMVTVTKMNEDAAIMVWNNDDQYLYARVITTSGSTPGIGGSVYEILNDDVYLDVALCTLSETRAVLAYRVWETPGPITDGWVVVIDRNGGQLQFSSHYAFANIADRYCNRINIGALDSERFVLSWQEDLVPGAEAGYSRVGKVTGGHGLASVTFYSVAAWLSAGDIVETNMAVINSEYFIVNWDIISGSTGDVYKLGKVNSTTQAITFSAANTNTAEDAGSEWATVPLSLSKALQVREGDGDGGSWQYLDAYTVNFDISTWDIRGLGLSLAKGGLDKVWVTANVGNDLRLLEYTFTPLTLGNEFSLGGATFAETAAQTYLCYPHVPFGYNNVVYVFGRMDNPASLGNPVHIIRTDNGGGTWNLIEDSWGVDHCGALVIGLDAKTYAIRNRAAQSKLYRDYADSELLLRLTFPWAGQVAPHGLFVSKLTMDVYVVAWVANQYMVSHVPPPHLLEKDITYDHDTTGSAEVIIQL